MINKIHLRDFKYKTKINDQDFISDGHVAIKSDFIPCSGTIKFYDDWEYTEPTIDYTQLTNTFIKYSSLLIYKSQNNNFVAINEKYKKIFLQEGAKFKMLIKDSRNIIFCYKGNQLYAVVATANNVFSNSDFTGKIRAVNDFINN